MPHGRQKARPAREVANDLGQRGARARLQLVALNEIAGGLGAKLAAPDRDVYVLVGDGSYLMMNSEIATAVAMEKSSTKASSKCMVRAPFVLKKEGAYSTRGEWDEALPSSPQGLAPGVRPLGAP